MLRTTVIITLLALLSASVSSSQENRIETIDTVVTIQRLDSLIMESMRRDRYDSVPDYIHRAKYLASFLGDTRQEAFVLTTSVIFYYRSRDYLYAQKECERLLELVKELPPVIETSYAYHLYGLIQMRLSDFETARVYLDRAKELFTALESSRNLNMLTFSYGLLAYQSKDYHTAKNHFEKSIRGFEELGQKYFVARAHYYLSASYVGLIKDGEESSGFCLREAQITLDEARIVADSFGYTEIQINAQKLQSAIWLLEGKPKAAIDLFVKYDYQRDSILYRRIHSLNRSITLEYEQAELLRTIEVQKKELEEKYKYSQRNKWIFWFSGIIILGLSLLALALYKNNALRNKMFRILRLKNEELLKAKNEAERASQMKSEFLSTVTHELRTPLYGITGITQLLLDEDLNERHQEYLRSLKFSGEYLLSLVNNILDINKLEAGMVGLDCKLFGLKNTVDEVCKALGQAIDNNGNKLQLTYDDAIPIILIGDPVVVAQILMNLISNAAKFTQNGTINLRISKESQDSKCVKIRFEVQDDGIGIPQDNQEVIFDNFTQGSVQINRRYGGTGLGLPIVKRLVNLMESEIHLSSEPGKGSTFSFSLDFDLPPEGAEADCDTGLSTLFEVLVNPMNKAKEMKENDASQAEKEIQVLLVEDNRINQMVSKKFLEKKGIACTVVENGKEAVEQTQSRDFDLILMDLNMPVMDGKEATRYIRAFNPNVPILALTALAMEGNEGELLKKGFNGVISKPFKAEEFYKKIGKYVGVRP